MNNELAIKLAYAAGFERALLEAGLEKDAGAWQWLKGLFGKTGPKNIVGGEFNKAKAVKKDFAAFKKRRAVQGDKSTAQLRGGGMPIQDLGLAQRMRAARANA